jgi:uncharacterized surface protein with fasciclin (FAS1) repeats
MTKLFKKTAFCCFGLLMLIASGCYDDKMSEEQFKTFDEETVSSYLEHNPERYSKFCAMLKQTGMFDLLNAYGQYTCFAPTNDAIDKYYAENGTDSASLSAELRREIVYNAILKTKFASEDFPEGSLPTLNFDNRFIFIHFGTEAGQQQYIFVNRDSRITHRDIEVHNGVIHSLDAVISVNKTSLPEVIMMDDKYSLFSEALALTGLVDSFPVMISAWQQEAIFPPIYGDGKVDQAQWLTPPSDLFGFTALIESDSIFQANGINNIDDLKNYAAQIYDKMYSQDRNITDPTDRKNSLNRFVSYHIIDRTMASNEFIPEKLVTNTLLPGTIFTSQFTTMLENSLMEVSTGTIFNRRKDGSGVRIIDPDNSAANGVYHGIDRLLTFDEGVINDVFNKRIRIDLIDIFPELATNKMRGSNTLFYIPLNYLKDFTRSEQCDLVHYSRTTAELFRKDELKLRGKNDFTITLPPIPAGTYEFRLGYLPNGNRGVCQMYFDGKPCGIPLNMTIAANDRSIGWIADSQTDDNGMENDKMMKNRGYLKGPNSAYGEYTSNTMRDYSSSLRRVVTTVTFDKMERHIFRVKSVEDTDQREFQMDYFEFVPLSYLAKEGRD